MVFPEVNVAKAKHHLDGDTLHDLQRAAHTATVAERVAKKRSLGGLLFIAIAMSAFSLLFALVRAKKTDDLDHRVTVAIQKQKNPTFDRAMHLVSWMGFPPQSRILPWTYPAVLAMLGFPIEAFFQFLGWGTGFFSFMIKRTMRRPRPNHPAINSVKANIGGSSFPSGHVINYVGVYGMLAYLAHTHIKNNALRRAVVGFLGTVLALVGPSRIHLGHHWLTDVLASYLLGFSYLIGLTWFYRRVKHWTGR